MCPAPKNCGLNPQTFWFLVRGTRPTGPSSLDEILATNLVQTEYCSSVRMIVLNTQLWLSAYVADCISLAGGAMSGSVCLWPQNKPLIRNIVAV